MEIILLLRSLPTEPSMRLVDEDLYFRRVWIFLRGHDFCYLRSMSNHPYADSKCI